MSDLAIRALNLSKKYMIGSTRTGLFSETITEILAAPFRHLNAPQEELWALQDVSFEVKPGEVVGIIGRNGAGKSTLLKVLSRITEPTTGMAEIHGKLGSLLEVGIGFHPDLTGRENIYLNGVILGMRKAEIAKKFDEIVAFSEVGKFVDTPMKHYSSGMYVRLAFAVAAYLEPDILVIDEVLAVGDAAFQTKCLGKIGDVSTEGRTVLFVSHNMPAIMNLCPRSILLHGGKVVADGPTKDVLDFYLTTIDSLTAVPLAQREDRKGNQKVKFLACELRDNAGQKVPCAVSGQDLVLAFKYAAADKQAVKGVHVEFEIYGRFHESLFQLATNIQGMDFDEIPANGEILLKIPRVPLQPGRYNFDIYCTVMGTMADYIQHAATLQVEPGNYFSSGRLPQPDHGTFLVDHNWSVTPIEAVSSAQLEP